MEVELSCLFSNAYRDDLSASSLSGIVKYAMLSGGCVIRRDETSAAILICDFLRGFNCVTSIFDVHQIFKMVNTVVPRGTNLISSVTLLARQFALISKQFSPMKLIEMPLIRSSPQNATLVVFVTSF